MQAYIKPGRAGCLISSFTTASDSHWHHRRSSVNFYRLIMNSSSLGLDLASGFSSFFSSSTSSTLYTLCTFGTTYITKDKILSDVDNLLQLVHDFYNARLYPLLTVRVTSSLVLGQRPIVRRPTLGIAHSQWAAPGPPSQWAAVGRAGRPGTHHYPVRPRWTTGCYGQAG